MTFAISVRPDTGSRREEQERQYKNRADDGHGQAGGFRSFKADQEENDDQLEDIIIQRPAELRNIQPDKGARHFLVCIHQDVLFGIDGFR